MEAQISVCVCAHVHARVEIKFKANIELHQHKKLFLCGFHSMEAVLSVSSSTEKLFKKEFLYNPIQISNLVTGIDL